MVKPKQKAVSVVKEGITLTLMDITDTQRKELEMITNRPFTLKDNEDGTESYHAPVVDYVNRGRHYLLAAEVGGSADHEEE